MVVLANLAHQFAAAAAAAADGCPAGMFQIREG